MPVIRSRRSKEYKVKDNGAHLPAYQQNSYLGMCSQYTIPVTPAVSKTALTTGSQVYVDLEEFECSTIDQFCFRFTIRAINDTKLAPVFYWFSEIEIRAEKGTGDVLQRIYPENMRLWYFLTMNEEERKYWADLGNFTITTDPKTGRQSIDVTQDNIIKAGETREIFLHLPSTFMQSSQIDMRHLVSELRFQLELSRDVLLDSTTQADFELENIHMLIQSYQETASDAQTKLDAWKKNHHKYVYLDCERLTYNDRTLQSNSKQRFNLDQFQNKSPFMMFVFKPSTNPTVANKSRYKYREIGDYGTIDLENSGGRSIYGNGNPAQSIDFFTKLHGETGNYIQKGCYIMNWSEDIKQSLAGIINGYQQFDGSNYYLSFEFDNEAVQETVALESFASPGFLAITDPLSPNGVGIFEINQKIERIPVNIANINDYTNRMNLLLDDTEVQLQSISGNNYDPAMIVTYTKASGDASSRVGLPQIYNQVPAFDSNNPTSSAYIVPRITQQGVDGWDTSANYQLEIYCYKFKELLINKNGRLTCREL